MIITSYFESGDLAHCITNDFFNISWKMKLQTLYSMISGLVNLHKANIIHKDYHSGNIFYTITNKHILAVTGDFGISKSAIGSSDDDDGEVYGIIPYVAPEVLLGKKYTKASDIYSFGMIMWELMTGRRPFWDKNHETDLIIEICDGFRPPIVTNAPEGYIELMQKCWHSDPNERPNAKYIWDKFWNELHYSEESNNPTMITKSPDVGPITINNPGAIYKSRPLSTMIKSAKFTKSLKSKSIILELGKNFYLFTVFIFKKINYTYFFKKGKRKLNNNSIENNNNEGIIKSFPILIFFQKSIT
jgi:serine/threonine protein kinase